jgi:hypothetical protein
MILNSAYRCVIKRGAGFTRVHPAVGFSLASAHPLRLVLSLSPDLFSRWSLLGDDYPDFCRPVAFTFQLQVGHFSRGQAPISPAVSFRLTFFAWAHDGTALYALSINAIG